MSAKEGLRVDELDGYPLKKHNQKKQISTDSYRTLGTRSGDSARILAWYLLHELGVES